MNIQKTIKENALSTQAYFEDLNKWLTTFRKESMPHAVEEDDGFVKVTDYSQPHRASEPISTTATPQSNGNPQQGVAAANQPIRIVRCEQRVSDLEMATRKKDEGNLAFKNAKHKEALSLYDLALMYVKPTSQFRESPESAILRSVILSNRALVHLKSSDPSAAVADCTAALEADAQNVKAMFRRAQANTKLCKYEEALRDLLVCKDSVGQEAEVEIQRVNTALEFQKEKQRVLSRKIMTDSSRKITKPLRSLLISKLNSFDVPDAEIPRSNAPYVPKAVRMAGGTAAKPTTTITSYAEFEKLWREKSRRLQILDILDLERLSAIFKESLDFDVFAEILECGLDSGDTARTAQLLLGLTRVKRFGLIVGLLEKAKLKTFVNALPDSSSRTELLRSYGL